MKNKILSICIPTYNRAWCIEEQLSRFKRIPKEFLMKLEIIISDNCSSDGTYDVVSNAINEGFSCVYIRNKMNIGMDGNFAQCYQSAHGQYVWLLGDDDFIQQEALYNLVQLLEKRGKVYDLIHYIPNELQGEPEYYNDNEQFINRISYHMTFISGSIINTKYVNTVSYEKYKGSMITQVPLVLKAVFGPNQNVLWGGGELLDPAKDYNNNGGYNFFEVFVRNYLTIMAEYIKNLELYACLKKDVWAFIWGYTKRLLIRKDKGNFKTENGWKILFKYYGNEWYFWWTLFKYPFGVVKRKIKKLL